MSVLSSAPRTARASEKLVDFFAGVLRKRSHEHHLLKHVMSRVVRGLEEREGGVPDKALRFGGLQEPGNFLGFPAADKCLPFVPRGRVPEFRPGFQERRSNRKPLVLVFGHRHGVPCNKVETRSVLGDPFFKPVRVELFDVLGDLREAQASLVFVDRVARHLGH